MDKPPPVPPDLVGEIDALAETLLARTDHADIARKFEWLLDALVMRGQLPQSYTKLAAKVRGDRSTVRLSLIQDKYQQEAPPVDCAALFPLCNARCCGMEVTLSAQDLADGIPYRIDVPYSLPRDEHTKRCTLMAEGGACTIYEKRPHTCRVYDCRNDRRVWLDFDAKIPAPLDDKLRPIPKP